MIELKQSPTKKQEQNLLEVLQGLEPNKDFHLLSLRAEI